MSKICSEKVLLVGSSIGMLDIARKIKNRGYELIVIGGIVDDPCHLIADKSIFVDYRDIESCITESLKYDIKYVVPGSNDIAFECALKIANSLKIKTFDIEQTIEILHNKSAFREFLEKIGVSQPKRYSIAQVLSQDFSDWPVIVKPDLAFSGKGITVLQDATHLNAAISKARMSSRDQNFIIEKFVIGQLYSVSSFISEGRVVYAFFSNEQCDANPYAVDYSFTPSNLRIDTRNKISNDLFKIASDLSLCDGLLHIQFIYDDREKKYYFIECMRRMIGDFYGKKISYSYGVDYNDLYLRPYLEETIHAFPIEKNDEIHRRILCSSKSYIFESYKNEDMQNIIEVIPLSKSGDKIDIYPNGKAAIVFYKKVECK